MRSKTPRLMVTPAARHAAWMLRMLASLSSHTTLSSAYLARALTCWSGGYASQKYCFFPPTILAIELTSARMWLNSETYSVPRNEALGEGQQLDALLAGILNDASLWQWSPSYP